MKNIKQFVKVIVFFFLLVPLFILGSKIFEPKRNDKDSGIHEASANGILGEKENTIDVLFLGNSIVYTSIIPMQLYKDYGITSYISGTPGQYINATYKYLKKALQKQNPKMVIIDADVIFGGIPKKALLNLTIENNIPLIKYHNRWKNLSLKDFTDSKNYIWSDSYKGYYFVYDVVPYTNGEYMKNTKEKENVSIVNKYYFHKIEALCKENNIELMIISCPSPKFWNMKRHNKAKEYTASKNYKYIDFNNILKEVGIDWNKDSLDNGMHINYYGAVKVTKYLGDYLNNLQILVDHRNDPYYESWNEVTNNFYRKVEHMK